jgi:hypothetical protein
VLIKGVFRSIYFTCFYLKKVKAEPNDPTQNSFFKAKQFFLSIIFTVGCTLILLRYEETKITDPATV